MSDEESMVGQRGLRDGHRNRDMMERSASDIWPESYCLKIGGWHDR